MNTGMRQSLRQCLTSCLTQSLSWNSEIIMSSQEEHEPSMKAISVLNAQTCEAATVTVLRRQEMTTPRNTRVIRHFYRASAPPERPLTSAPPEHPQASAPPERPQSPPRGSGLPQEFFCGGLPVMAHEVP